MNSYASKLGRGHYNHIMSFRNFESLIKSSIPDSKKPVMVGVSGGPDSICLLDLCCRCDLSVIVGHVNHKLREESDREERFVRELALFYGTKYICKTLAMDALRNRSKTAVEEKARTLRYQFLFEQAKMCGAQAVLTAHNADDQVETFLMHLLRGSGLSGLAGMDGTSLPNEWDTKIPLVRPLLLFFRKEILEYCELRQLKYVTDKSNYDRTFFRNRIRNELIPIMETYNPKFKKLAIQTIDQISKEDNFLSEQTTKILRKISFKHVKEMITFTLHDFLSEYLSSQRRIIKFCLRKLLPDERSLNFITIDRAISFCHNSQPGRHIDLVKNINLKIEDSKAVFFLRGHETTVYEFPQMIFDQILINQEMQVGLSENYVIEFNLIKNLPIMNLYRQFEDEVFLAAESISGPLFFRKRMLGDKFSPLGEPVRHLKLSDLMINKKIPAVARANYPILCDQAGILWVPFLRMADRGKVLESTEMICHFTIRSNLLRN